MKGNKQCKGRQYAIDNQAKNRQGMAIGMTKTIQ